MKVLIIVPAYNEEQSITTVIQSLKETNQDWHIMVVNDCSKDNTASVAEACQHATVVSLPCNLGVGGAVQTGFKYAKRHGYDLALKFDGDGQHLASEINILIKPLESQQADVIIGSRFLSNSEGFKSTFTRRIGIKIFQIVNSIIVKQKITDNTSGFRAYNKKAIHFLAEYYPSFDYPEPEEVILMGKNNFKLLEVPIKMQARQGGVSSIGGFKSIYFMLKVLLAIIMVAMRPKLIKGTH